MADQNLAKAILALMIIVLFVQLVAAQPPSGASLPPANSNLTNLTGQFNQSFPSFVNPFEQTEVRTFTPIANGSRYNAGWIKMPPASATNTAGVDNCNGTAAGKSYWGCLTQADGAGSYVTLNSGKPTFALNMSTNNAGGEGYVVADFVMDYECRVSSSSVIVSFYIFLSNGTINFFVTSATGCSETSFTNHTYKNELQITHTLGEFSANAIWVITNITGGTADFSFLNMIVDYTHTSACGTGLDGIGCNLYNFARTVFDGILFFINGLIFLGTVVIWFIGMVVAFFSLIVGSLWWIMSMPGTPPIVSGALLAGVATVLALVILGFAHLVRGTEG